MSLQAASSSGPPDPRAVVDSSRKAARLNHAIRLDQVGSTQRAFYDAGIQKHPVHPEVKSTGKTTALEPDNMPTASKSSSKDMGSHYKGRVLLRGELPPPGHTFNSSATTFGEASSRTGDLPVHYITLEPGWGPSSLSQYQAHDFWYTCNSTGFPPYLFHGCSLSIDSDAEAVITSLQFYGPSLRYARNSGFLFRHKAVYWSNSFEYAVMWCFFRSNGYWPQDWSQIEDLRCLIFVARLSKEEFNGLGKIDVVPPPRDKREEEEFEKVGRMRVDESMISNARG